MFFQVIKFSSVCVFDLRSIRDREDDSDTALGSSTLSHVDEFTN